MIKQIIQNNLEVKERIENVNFIDVKNDASKFLLKKEDLSFYSKDLFFQMIDKL